MPFVDQTNDEYHSDDTAVSKSKLWKLWNKTPFHAKYEPYKPSHAFDFGTAAHTAILEPELLESVITRGPETRRGNQWKEAMDFAEFNNTTLLIEKDYDSVLVIRDLADTLSELRTLRNSEHLIEQSCYAMDEEFDIGIKCRGDFLSTELNIGLDIKNMASASPNEFDNSIGKFGYHMQDTMYRDVWRQGAGLEIETFFFIVFEKGDPPTVAMYEMDRNTALEGYAVYRAALKKYAEAFKNDEWPSYPTEIQPIGLRRYHYKLTKPELEMTYDDE
ncbi:PD-(D/E)XK nuclease-like domain-containing protein [uncultured Paraglaciecola sp.]|uniref:PD-(D/E)XK nuclease-like domain-containing protein n=1 Tax=uncultured Paraglaciecola sp. TaxID=1765024 RepID=UPI002620F5DC|nr:PD-(D/E)XK nuclease-like domain-containing protein [uncultured Paraglaciecola sp.]